MLSGIFRNCFFSPQADSRPFFQIQAILVNPRPFFWSGTKKRNSRPMETLGMLCLMKLWQQNQLTLSKMELTPTLKNICSPLVLSCPTNSPLQIYKFVSHSSFWTNVIYISFIYRHQRLVAYSAGILYYTKTWPEWAWGLCTC